jgi:hypothetical protein
MRVLPLLVLLAAAGACKAEDDGRTVTPPGGGNGGNGDDIDGGGGDDSDGGAGALTGEVCIVQQLDDPFECASSLQASGVLVEIVGSTTNATSDASGEFEIDVTTGTSTLQVGSGSFDLRLTRFKARLADAPVAVPAVTNAAWEEAIAPVFGESASAAVVVYVLDNGAPLAGATVTLDGSTERFYDGGAQLLDPEATATGNAGMATFLNAASGEVVVTDGTRTEMAIASTTASATGVVVVDLGD